MSEAPRGRHGASVDAARRALVAWVDAAGEQGRVFLQARIVRTAEGYALRHRDDAEVPARQLDGHRDPFTARRIAQTTSEGEHRPLKTAPNLRRGWTLEGLDAGGLWTALDYLYPACAVHWHAGREGTLEVTSWEATAARQSGIYASVRLLSPPATRRAVQACCADAVCLRRVEWPLADGEAPVVTDAGEAGGDARVPCPEACSLFISLARQLLQVEREPRVEVPGIGQVAVSEAEQLRELAQPEATRDRAREVREGEFEDPLNERRVRYLAARLGEEAA
jgi:hypothetical protein